MKTVLLLISPASVPSLSAGSHYAISLARSHGAGLSALLVQIGDSPPSLPREPDNMQGDDTMYVTPSPAEMCAQMVNRVLDAAKNSGVACEILPTEDRFFSLRERVTYSAQVRDIMIIDVFGPLHAFRQDLVDGALFGSGRPLVLVPQNVGEFGADRILVAWDATHSAARAVHDAMPLLVKARDVTIVSVIDDKTFLRPDTGEMLSRYLARWSVDAKYETISRGDLNVGATLLTYAKKTGANMLVMGGFAHGFERDLMHGSATRDIFRSTLEMPVFLSH